MGCFQNQTSTWDTTLDYRIIYTGPNIIVTGMPIMQGDNYQSVIQTLIDAITYVDQKVYYTPYIKVDNTISFTMTGEEIENKHPDTPIGAIVYNDIEGFEFSKLALNTWKFQTIDIRK